MPTGPEFRVDAAASGLRSPEIAGLADGSFVVTWLAAEPSYASSDDIHARRYAADGTPIGGEFLVNDIAAGDQATQEVTALADGGFVVTWMTYPHPTRSNPGAPPHDISARRFGADGAPVGGEFLVNTGRIVSQPAAASHAGGKFVVTWSSFSSGNSFDIHARRFGADGSLTGAEFRVHDDLAGSQVSAAVAALTDGEFAATWSSADGTGYGNYDVYARRFAADGSPVGAEFRVHDAVAGDQDKLTGAAPAGADPGAERTARARLRSGAPLASRRPATRTSADGPGAVLPRPAARSSLAVRAALSWAAGGAPPQAGEHSNQPGKLTKACFEPGP